MTTITQAKLRELWQMREIAAFIHQLEIFGYCPPDWPFVWPPRPFPWPPFPWRYSSDLQQDKIEQGSQFNVPVSEVFAAQTGENIEQIELRNKLQVASKKMKLGLFDDAELEVQRDVRKELIGALRKCADQLESSL